MTRSSSRADAQPKCSIALGAMADHAVGGVDRLVDGGARQSADRHPEGGRHHAVGEILGEALDRRARDAGLVERAQYRGRRSPTLLRARCSIPSSSSASANSLYMSVQAPLGDQRAGDDGEGDHAEGQEQEPMLDEHRPVPPETRIRIESADAPARFPPPWRRSLAVQPAVERADQRAHPRDRMTDCARDAAPGNRAWPRTAAPAMSVERS